MAALIPHITRAVVTFGVSDNADIRALDVRQNGRNMSFRVVLELEGDSYPKLAEISLQWGADGSYVWLVSDGKVSRMPVDIVQRQQGKVLVETNLRAGDLVVVEGFQKMGPGTEVIASAGSADYGVEPSGLAMDSVDPDQVESE